MNKVKAMVEHLLPENFKEVAKDIIMVSLPIIFANICNFGLSVVDTMFVGHLGTELFAGAALGSVWTSTTFFIAIGFSFAMDTLVSQAYGAGNYKLMGIILQNAFFVATIAAIPVGMLWLYTENIMLLLGIAPELAKVSGIFSRYMVFGLLPNSYFVCLQKYLQNQMINTPSLVVGAIGFVLNVIFNYVFIYALGLGFIGAPIATSVSRTLLPIMLFLYAYKQKLFAKTWTGWSKEMVSVPRLKTYIKFGVTSGLMILFEVCGFELSTLVASLLVTPTELNAHSIAFNSMLVSFTVPLAISIGASTVVGNYLGEGNPHKAKNAATSGFILNILFLIFNAVLLMSFRKLYGRMYTTDEAVLAIAPNIIIFSACATFLDGCQVYLGGILRGAGVPKAGSIINFIGYYGVCGTCYAILGIVAKWRLYAVWSGLLIGLTFINVCYAFFMVRINWEQESINAKDRSQTYVEVEQLVDKTEDETIHDTDLEKSQEMFTILDEEEQESEDSNPVHKLS